MNFTFLLADLPSSTIAAPSSPASLPVIPIPPEAIWTLIFIALLLLVTLAWFFSGLRNTPGWSIGDAVSEEAGNQPATLPAGVKPIMVASSSRLIAMLGLLVLICMSIGVGFSIICSIFEHQQLQIQGLLSYFYGMGALFAPYAVNQLKDAFNAFTAPTPAGQTPGNTGQANDGQVGNQQGGNQPPNNPPPANVPLQPAVRLPALKAPNQLGAPS